MLQRDATKIAVIGSGAMGLACAYDLLKDGHEVDIFEQDNCIGGMSASFDFDGLPIERFYHFVCGPDYPLFNILQELDIFCKLKWTETKMGFYYEGQLYKWGNPLYLLGFPKANMLDKLRYGVHLFFSSKRSDWGKLDEFTAVEWIIDCVGPKAYDTFWKPLFDLKFYEYAKRISAAWIWTRIKRVALSRKNIFVESMGYIEGGSATLFTALSDKIIAMGGKIHLGHKIDRIHTIDGKVRGVELDNKVVLPYNKVISTIPLPYVSALAPDLPEEIKKKYQVVDNIGVVCVILKLKYPLTENFWLNINDKSINIPGIIEYSNLNPLSEKIVYVPFYLHKDNPKFAGSDQSFIDEVLQYAKRIVKDFSPEWVIGKVVHRYEYAQPVCPPGYLKMLPDIATPIEGLYIADTSYYYPEDRSISESIRLGREIAHMIRKDLK